MQNFKNYLSQLSKRDYVLLIFSIALISFVIIKFLLIDKLLDNNSKLVSKSTVVLQQEKILSNLNVNSSLVNLDTKSSNQLINSFLKKNSASKSLKQIRTTNNGAQRYELEDITFTSLVQLLSLLETSSIPYNSLKINKTKKDGIVDAVLTVE